MQPTTITFQIRRYKPGRIDPPRYQDYKVQYTPRTTILDGLEQIRLTQDPTLMYRHCCHHASCGTCACMINNAPALACTTPIADLKTAPIVLEPLANHPCLGDLAVDMTPFMREMAPEWATLRTCNNTTNTPKPKGVNQFKRLENCIECGCCTAACPITAAPSSFTGPAVLAAINTELRNRPEKEQEMQHIAASPRGASMCKRHLNCSRVCPSKVYPARHIADLQRSIAPPTTKPEKKTP